jgi:hypothetical protein
VTKKKTPTQLQREINKALIKRVELRVRHIMSRTAFTAGDHEASLDVVDADGIPTGVVAFTTRGHKTWESAASVALAKADRKAWEVTNRWLVARRIASAEPGS